MNNVKFHYLYRDGSNYKNWGEVVFFNDGDLSLELIAKLLSGSFMEDGLFVAHQVRIPEVFLATEGHLTEDDHCFHEFGEIEATTDAPSDRHGRSISEFIA